MTRGGARLAAVLFAALWTAGAAAQAPLPADAIAPEARERFRLCRAAIFIHLADEGAVATTLTREATEAMNEQIGFIMSETLSTAPNASVAEGRRMLDFAERFFIDFSVAIAENREALADDAAREALLVDCQPLIWAAMRQQIDYLMAWRANALRAAGAPGPLEGGPGP